MNAPGTWNFSQPGITGAFSAQESEPIRQKVSLQPHGLLQDLFPFAFLLLGVGVGLLGNPSALVAQNPDTPQRSAGTIRASAPVIFVGIVSALENGWLHADSVAVVPAHAHRAPRQRPIQVWKGLT